MKKIMIKKVMAFSLISFTGVHATIDYSLAIRGALFVPSSKLFKNIYGKVGGNVQVEGGILFCKWGGLWANFDWLSDKGKSIGFCNDTYIKNATFSFGTRFLYPLNDCFSLYIGAGPAFGKVWLTNQGICGCEKVSKRTVGGLFKAGLYYFMTDCVFWDVFCDYLYQPVNFESRVNLGGVKVGLGLGVMF